MRPALSVILVGGLIWTGMAAARPAGTPIERLNAVTAVVRVLERVERRARDAGVHNPESPAIARTMAAIAAAQDTVAKEIAKAQAAGLKPAYVAELKDDLSFIRGHDSFFESEWRGGDDRGAVDHLEAAQGGKEHMVALIQRYIHRATAPVVPYEQFGPGLVKAIDTADEARKALARHGEIPLLDKTRGLIEVAVDHIHHLDDAGLVPGADAGKALDALAEARHGLISSDESLRETIAEIRSAMHALEHGVANPPPTPAAPAKTGKPGPACVAGSWTSQPVKIETPTLHRPVLYFAETPIPNAEYYAHKHGFSGGGCDRIGGRLQANIDVYNSSGKLIAWSYDYGAFPSPNPVDGPKAVHSGTDCPRVVDGHNVDECTVDGPRLGVRTPAQGFEPPAGFTQQRSDFRFLAVVFGVSNRGAPEDIPGSVTIKVTWQPKK